MTFRLTACEQDAFAGVLGSRRGTGVAAPLTALAAAYAAFTPTDLDIVELLADDPAVRGILRAAQVEPQTLDRLGDDFFTRVHARQYIRLGPASPGSDTDALLGKLQRCIDERENVHAQELADAGGRPFEMYTVAGNIAVAQLIDRLAGLGRPAAQITLAEGLTAIRREHREVSDTAVREAIWSELDALGLDLEL